MKPRSCLMMFALLVLPGLSVAGDQLDAEPVAAKPAFDLKTAKVQNVIRNYAASQTTAEKTELSESAPTDLEPLPFRAPRRVHHVDCDSFNCVAYTADNDALFSVPRDQYFGVTGNGSSSDAWLACQSGNNLLSTFERFDKCRGVSVGLPVQGSDLTVNVPLFRR